MINPNWVYLDSTPTGCRYILFNLSVSLRVGSTLRFCLDNRYTCVCIRIGTSLSIDLGLHESIWTYCGRVCRKENWNSRIDLEYGNILSKRISLFS